MHGKDSSIEKQTFVSFDAYLVRKNLRSKKVTRGSCNIDGRGCLQAMKRIVFIAIVLVTRKVVEERKRASQGLSKIDRKCSAFMKVVVDSVSKEVNVE